MFISHATNNPVVTIIMGIFFIVAGIVRGSWFIDITQISAEPEIIDIQERTSIGVVKDFPSSKWINGPQFEGPQIVASLNRVV